MRGWIYVMTNLAMPGLVKIGFSTKDPHLRAKELDGTALPHPFVVAYDAIVEGPRDVEKLVHKALGPHHAGKEFFSVTISMAVEAIRTVLVQQQKSALLEKHHASNQSSLRTAHLEKPEQTNVIPSRYPAPRKGRTGTVRFEGACGYCRGDFSVTLTRHDSSAVCPNCFTRNSVVHFLEIAFSEQ